MHNLTLSFFELPTTKIIHFGLMTAEDDLTIPESENLDCSRARSIGLELDEG